MPPVKQHPCPFAPLIFDDEEAIGGTLFGCIAAARCAFDKRKMLYDRDNRREGCCHTRTNRIRSFKCVLHDIRPVAI